MASYLEIRPLRAAYEELQLVLHVRDDGCLHCDGQVPRAVAEEYGKGVVHVTLDAAVRREETGDGLGAAEKRESLVERVGTETKGHAVARLIVSPGPGGDPARGAEVEVDLGVADGAQGVEGDEVLKGPEVAVVSSV